MFEALNIPLPPMPGGALGMFVGVAGLLTGLALLLLGRVVVWRLAAAACLGGCGVLVAAWLAARADHSLLWLTAIGGGCMALVGFALARLFWAIAVSVFAAGASELALLTRMLPNRPVDVAGFDAAGLTLAQWTRQAALTVGDWLGWMADTDLTLTIVTGAAAGFAGLVLGIARPMAIRIFGTAVAGAALIVGGACLTLTSLVGPVGLTAGYRGWIVAFVGGAVAIAGMVYQVRSHRRSRAEPEKDDEGEPEKPK